MNWKEQNISNKTVADLIHDTIEEEQSISLQDSTMCPAKAWEEAYYRAIYLLNKLL